jgi:hypothetical protein
LPLTSGLFGRLFERRTRLRLDNGGRGPSQDETAKGYAGDAIRCAVNTDHLLNDRLWITPSRQTAPKRWEMFEEGRTTFRRVRWAKGLLQICSRSDVLWYSAEGRRACDWAQEPVIFMPDWSCLHRMCYWLWSQARNMSHGGRGRNSAEKAGKHPRASLKALLCDRVIP